MCDINEVVRGDENENVSEKNPKEKGGDKDEEAGSKMFASKE